MVRQEAVKMGKMEVFQVGLKFEHPEEELRALTDELLRSLSSGSAGR